MGGRCEEGGKYRGGYTMEGRCVCMLTSCCAGRMWVGESIYERVDVYDRRVILSEGAYILWEGGGIL